MRILINQSKTFWIPKKRSSCEWFVSIWLLTNLRCKYFLPNMVVKRSIRDKRNIQRHVKRKQSYKDEEHSSLSGMCVPCVCLCVYAYRAYWVATSYKSTYIELVNSIRVIFFIAFVSPFPSIPCDGFLFMETRTSFHLVHCKYASSLDWFISRCINGIANNFPTFNDGFLCFKRCVLILTNASVDTLLPFVLTSFGCLPSVVSLLFY